MATVHFLNVGKGDCTLIRHNSGRNSLIDVCKGNYEPPKEGTVAAAFAAIEEARESLKGNFGMSKKPTNPITYLEGLNVDSVFRFILTHPDMDHLDGFDSLMNRFPPNAFWDSGVRKDKPDFDECVEYEEADWDRYSKVCEGKEDGIKVIRNLAGSRFQFANRNEKNEAGGDGLYILAPDDALVKAANECGDVNDGSYVLLYRSSGGRILIPGDAHDETWDYVIKNYRKDVADCSVLFAPHHGRKSGRNFDFLDVVKPEVTFFGCASSGHLAYNAWSSRGLRVITNNQAGNIVMECGDGNIDIYVENSAFAEASGSDIGIVNDQGYVFLESIEEVKEE